MTGVRRVGSGGTGPSPGPTGTGEYTVRPGDTLDSIARRFGVSVGALLRWNPRVQDPDRILPGQVLRIPAGPPGTSRPSATLSPGGPRDTYEKASSGGLFGTRPTLPAVRGSSTAGAPDACSAFEEALRIVLRFEGGYANHPSDPGGPTYRGITQKTYDAWRKAHGDSSPRDVRSIADAEVRAIYREGYWQAAHCDKLPPPLHVVVFDVAVNSGPGRALRFLQEALGVPVTGRWDRQTRDAVEALRPSDVRVAVESILNLRECFYRQMALEDPKRRRFLQGWLNRLARLREYCAQFWAQSAGGG